MLFKAWAVAAATILICIPALADVPPPPTPLPFEGIDAAAADAVDAQLKDSRWTLALTREGETYSGELDFLPGNRFTLIVRSASGREQNGGGVWGLVDPKADGSFILALAILEVEDDGEYDADDVLAFRLAPDGETLKGEMMDGRKTFPLTLTRR